MQASKSKVLVTDLVDHVLINGLVEAGYAVDYEKDIAQAEVDSIIQHYTGIVITTKIGLSANNIHQAVNSKWIARAGSGLDHVDVGEAIKRNIACITSPEGNAGSVGEHAVMMLLSMLRRFHQADSDTKQYRWNTDEFRVRELDGMTIGILGYGNTGPAFAKRLQGFNVNVIAHDKYKLTFDDDYAKWVELEALCHQADVLSIHLPLTGETRNMIDNAFLARFSKRVLLINTSRGNLLPVQVLAEALENGLVEAAAVDVLDNESFETHTPPETELYKRLLAHPGLLVTPHVAGKSSATRRRHAETLLAKILVRRGL